jgi:hypothetical protein
VIDVQRVDYIHNPVTDLEEANRFCGVVLRVGTLALRVADVADAKAKLEAAGVMP